MLTFFSIYRLEKFHLWHREKGHGATSYGRPGTPGLSAAIDLVVWGRVLSRVCARRAAIRANYCE